MSEQGHQAAAEALRRLRRLERRMRSLHRAWRAFRSSLDADFVPDLGLRLDEARDELYRLAGLLGIDSKLQEDSPPGQPSESVAQPRRPAGPAGYIRADEVQAVHEASLAAAPLGARDLIRASRSLDSLIWNASADWMRFCADSDADHLASLENRLRRAMNRLMTLRKALPEGDSPAVEESLSDLPPESALAIERQPSVSSTGPGPVAQGQALGGLLWTIASDWQSLRRAPSADRATVLLGELGNALAQVNRLRGKLGSGSQHQGISTTGAPGTSAGTEAPRVSFHLYRDGFTGAYNRDGFEAIAGAELKRCRRYERSFGLLLIQVSAGDLDQLRSRMQVIQEELRDYDLLARYVDQLIAVGLPESGREGTLAVANRVRMALRKRGLDHPQDRLAFACLPEDAVTLSALLNTAQRRLEQVSEP